MDITTYNVENDGFLYETSTNGLIEVEIWK